MYYTVAGSGQAGQTSWNFGLSSSQAWAYTVREWNSSTGWNSSPVETSASAVSGNGNGQSTTLSTGTTSTTTQFPELWVGALGWDSQGQSESGLTWGWTQGALGSAGGTISNREAYGVANGIGGAYVNETLSAAEYSTGVVATFEPAGQGGGGGGGGNCNSTGAPNNNVSSQSGGTYHLQANEFNSSAELDINSDCNTDFSVPNSQINGSLSAAPGGYPSLYKGCHWGYCTTSDPLPVTVASMAGGGVVTTSASTTLPSGQAENFDDSYDIWFNPNTSTTNNSTGLELMIWLNHAGTVQPAGSRVATNVNIGGTSYDVWDKSSGAGATVTYVADSPVTSVTSLDLGPFATDLMNNHYMPTGWYLIDVEAGFEFWTGGTGAAYNSFSVCVNGSC
jgi:cellulose 1,4-beta-cellobiosidase